MDGLEPAELKLNTPKAVQFQWVDEWSGRRDSNPQTALPRGKWDFSCAVASGLGLNHPISSNSRRASFRLRVSPFRYQLERCGAPGGN
jgi:hypothetical protein